MKKQPRFSVIIPSYNAEKYIHRAIESVLEQTYPVQEIIIVDDGSIDNTKEVVTRYPTNLVKYVFQENQGVSAARNNGVRVAGCDWVAFLDADDWYYKDRIQRHVSLLNRYPYLDFMTGNFDYIDVDGNYLGNSMEGTVAGKRLLQDQNSMSEVLMEGHGIVEFISHPFGDTRTLTLRKETFLKLGGFPVEFNICEDVHFLMRLSAASRHIGVVKNPMAAYLVHDCGLIRTDPFRAQTETLSAISTLFRDATMLENKWARKGLVLADRRVRLDLAYTYLKRADKNKALKAVLPILLRNPKFRSIKDMLSILIG